MQQRAGAYALVVGGVAIAIAIAYELTRSPAPRVLAEDAAAPPIRTASPSTTPTDASTDATP